MVIKTYEGQDIKGHLHSSRPLTSAVPREHHRREDNNELNREDARVKVSGTENV